MGNFFQEFKIADERACRARWSGGANGKWFFCGFCGHQFKIGDKYKAVYTNDIPECSGNPLICEGCHKNKTHEEVRDVWRQKCEFLRQPQFRWFMERYE